MNQEIAAIKLEVDEKMRSGLFALAEHPKVEVWVDANVMMYAKKEFKKRLLEFSKLRTVPEVTLEVGKRDEKTSYLLGEFYGVGGFTVGADSFKKLQLDALYNIVLSHAASYSPFTQRVITENLETNGSSSPIENNMLESSTNSSSFLETPENATGIAAAFGLAAEHEAECKKLREAWFKYHREREQRVKAKSYLWTDEKLVASAITNGLANHCVSVILTTDWDPYVIIKQFIDNIVYQSCKVKLGGDGTEEFDILYRERCSDVDEQNIKRRAIQSMAILDGQLFESCEAANLFVWHYPTESYLSFHFSRDFQSWMKVVSES